MAATMVSPEKIRALEERMKALDIREEDIMEKFVRCQGRGGQKLNKTSSCVWLRHEPSGIEVKCQQERSQAMNRFFARRLLVEKVEESVLGKAAPRAQRSEKIRKQKKKKALRARKKLISNQV